MIVIPGPASQELGQKVAERLNVETVGVVFKKFPDGETYIRLQGDLKGEELVIVQTTSPPQAAHLMQLFLMADTAKELGAKKVTAVVPYLAYARQDKRFLPGEAVSVRTVAKLLAASGVDHLLTVNVHEEKVLEKFSFPARSLSAMTVLAEHFKQNGLVGAFAVAPDEGALELAEEAAKVLGGGYGWLSKKRDKYTGEIMTRKKQFDVERRDVIVFDDIISSGRTTANAVKILKEQNARQIYAACAHPLLIGDAKKIIMQEGAETIVGTDSVPSSISVVSVAPLIARALTEKEAY